jgi:hypothetical protein
MIKSMTNVLLTMLVATAISAAPVRLTIRVEPAAELPAIPLTLHVEATNLSDAPVTIPSVVAMQVIPPEGEPFVAVAGMRGESGATSFPGERFEVTLAPRETRDLTFWSSPDSALFGNDERLYRPGRYRFQLVVAPELMQLDFVGVKTLVNDAELTDPIVSNEVTFTALEPKGDDAIVFGWIKEPPVSDIRDIIWEKYPNSRYAPYNIPNPDDYHEHIAFYQAAVAKAPTAVIADRWRLNIAFLKLVHLRSILTEEDLAAADVVMSEAGPILRDLVKRARDPQIRAEAAELLAKRVSTHAELEYWLRRERGEMTDIEPSIVCAGPDGQGRSVAWLTYYNPGKLPKSSPVGERNKFTPPPFDRGQPTMFKIYLLPECFKVVFGSPTLTWHIDATNLLIDPKKAPHVCPADMDEFYDEYFRGQRDWPDEASDEK